MLLGPHQCPLARISRAGEHIDRGKPTLLRAVQLRQIPPPAEQPLSMASIFYVYATGEVFADLRPPPPPPTPPNPPVAAPSPRS